MDGYGSSFPLADVLRVIGSNLHTQAVSRHVLARRAGCILASPTAEYVKTTPRGACASGVWAVVPASSRVAEPPYLQLLAGRPGKGTRREVVRFVRCGSKPHLRIRMDSKGLLDGSAITEVCIAVVSPSNFLENADKVTRFGTGGYALQQQFFPNGRRVRRCRTFLPVWHPSRKP